MDSDASMDEPDELILEGVAVTTDVDGRPHFAPMGPIVDRNLTCFRLRPFNTSQTFQNLRRTGGCVFHVVDDVELLARSAVGRLDSPPATFPTPGGDGWILSDCCRWFELRAEQMDETQQRVDIRCHVAAQGRQRDFFGWNRAKHAVLEAAILATRLGMLSADEVHAQLERLRPALEKTAGKQERRAMEFLQNYIQAELQTDPPTPR